jgi:hypothetical protein
VGDSHTFAHAIIVGVYVGIGRIQYQRVVSCVTAEDTLGVGDVSPCFALGEHYFGGKQNHHYRFGSFRGGPPHPPLYGPQPTVDRPSHVHPPNLPQLATLSSSLFCERLKPLPNTVTDRNLTCVVSYTSSPSPRLHPSVKQENVNFCPIRPQTVCCITKFK